MQANLFDFDASKKKIIIGVHKGLRGEMVRLVREYKEEHGKLPMLPKRRHKVMEQCINNCKKIIK